MILQDEALVLTLLPHGEHGAVVRFLTFGHGLRAAYVPGARGRAKRALLQPGNRVALTLKARGEAALPTATVELVQSRALLAFRAETAAGLAWLSELTATALTEAVPHPRLAEALDALLAGLAAESPDWAATVARYELMLLEEMGFGLDLASCALGGRADDLAFVSPKTGRAVSRAMAAGQPWESQLLPLPAFLLTGGAANAADTAAALSLTGHFLARHWLADHPRLAPLRQRVMWQPS
jgi:DNA repair protein RecO (recombination protein O)